MKALRDILVAIKDTCRPQPAALRKAGQLAESSGARLTLFHALTTPLAARRLRQRGPDRCSRRSSSSANVRWRSWRNSPPRWQARGVAVNVATDWDFPAYEAVIRQARRQGADLVVAERHATRHLLPSLLRFNDWELLRRCPVPVLLVKRSGDWQRPVVLAAIDPAHSFAKPAKLDAMIMAARGSGGRAHWPASCTSRMPGRACRMPASMEELAIGAPGHRTGTRAAMRAALRCGDRRRRAWRCASGTSSVGNPVELIPKLARRHRAGIVVMGAISRSGLQRLVVGNVAEQVLDSLSCDVLVVKPAEFKTRVQPQRRGVQLIATPSYVA